MQQIAEINEAKKAKVASNAVRSYKIWEELECSGRQECKHSLTLLYGKPENVET